MLRAQARLCCLLICFLDWLVAAAGNMAESGCKPVLLSSLSQSEPDSKFCPHVDIFGCAHSQRAPACPGGLSWRFPDIPAICFLAPWPPVLGALSRSVRLPSPSVPPIHFTPPLWNTSVCRKDQRKKHVCFAGCWVLLLPEHNSTPALLPLEGVGISHSVNPRRRESPFECTWGQLAWWNHPEHLPLFIFKAF